MQLSPTAWALVYGRTGWCLLEAKGHRVQQPWHPESTEPVTAAALHKATLIFRCQRAPVRPSRAAIVTKGHA